MPICSKSQVAAGRWEGNEPRFFFILVNVLPGVAGPRSRGPDRTARVVVCVPWSEGSGAKRSQILPRHDGPNRNVLHGPVPSRYTGTPALNAMGR